MRWLIWKEFRLQWPIVVMGFVLMLVPFVVPLAVVLLKGWNAVAISQAFVVNAGFTIVMAAVFGGHAIGIERQDRSREFLAVLPVSKPKIVLSKLVWPVVTIGLMWAIHAAVLAAWEDGWRDPPVDGQVILLFALASWASFGIAWLVSTLQDSPIIAAGAGLAIPWAAALAIVYFFWLIDIDAEQLGIQLWGGLVLNAGLLCFAAGTWRYVRGVEVV